jgi:probable HAF family extracellular repeat protein
MSRKFLVALVLAVVTFFSLGGVTGAAWPPMFVYEDVGPANGFDNTEIFFSLPTIGINDGGEVAGVFVKDPSQYHAFVKTPGQPAQDLGPDGKMSSAADINNDGAVIGNIDKIAIGWYPDGIGGYTTNVVGWAPDQPYVGTKINDHGAMLLNGFWRRTTTHDYLPPWTRTIIQAGAAYWGVYVPDSVLDIHYSITNGVNFSDVKIFDNLWHLTDYTNFHHPVPSPVSFGMNNNEVAVGILGRQRKVHEDGFGDYDYYWVGACLWGRANFGGYSFPTFLPDFSINPSELNPYWIPLDAYARAINNDNKVVGYALTPEKVHHACLWPQVDTIEDLGTLGGESYAMAINDNDWIVGHYGDNAHNNPMADVRPFLRTPNDKLMWDLNHRVTNLPNGVVLKYALAINKDNQIAGYASNGRPFRLIPDTQPPTASITINGGATFSGSRSVILNLSASDPEVAPGIPGSGVGWVRFSDHQWGGVEQWGSWYPYDPLNPTMTWTFDSGDARYVKAQFSDRAGNVTTVQDDIIVDTTPPSADVVVNDGRPWTNNPNATLYLNSTDPNVAQMRFGYATWLFGGSLYKWGFWTAYQPSVSWTLNEGPNYKMVQFKDAAGNESAVCSVEVILDTRGPTGYTFSINGGAKVTGSPYATLRVAGGVDAGSGVSMIRFSDEWRLGAPVWKPWEPYIPDNPGDPNPIVTKSWTFSGVDGVKNMCAQLADSVGNVWTGFPAEASITLDTTRPKDGTLKATPGRFSITLDCAGFEDSGTGIKLYRVWASTSGFPAFYAPAKTAILAGRPPLGITGLKQGTTYYFRVQAVDMAGNISLPGPTIKASTLGGPQPHLNLLLGD